MNTISNTEWLAHLATSWALFGLIWTIQLSHYPSFKFVAENQFSDFHLHHTRSISLIVLPLMLLELGLVFWQSYQTNWSWTWMVPLVLVLLIWASTFFISVPLHEQLEAGKNLEVIKKLVDTNWVRTILWSVKTGWVSYVFFKIN